MRRLSTAMIACALGALAVAAIAGGALKTKQAEVSVDPGATESATAKCKKGTRAVSGGFDMLGVSADDNTLKATASMRAGRREWISGIDSHPSATDPQTLVSFAYCSDELPKLKAKSSSSTTVPNNELESLSVRCPRGGEAISGGFETPGTGSNQVQVFESRRVAKREWVVTASGTSGSESRLNAFVYCAKDKLGLKAKVASASTAADAVELSAKARCKKGQRVVSGGFGNSLDFDAGGYVEPFESLRAGRRGWQASTAVYNLPNAPPVRWDVYAYCLEKEKAG